jgi:hypothetical protein
MSHFSVGGKSVLLIALSVLALILTLPAINMLLDMTLAKEPANPSFGIAGSLILVTFVVLICAANVRKRFDREERVGLYFVGRALFWLSVGVWLAPALSLVALVLLVLSFQGSHPG